MGFTNIERQRMAWFCSWLLVAMMAMVMVVGSFNAMGSTGHQGELQQEDQVGPMLWTWDETNLRWEAAHPLWPDECHWWLITTLVNDETVYQLSRMSFDADTGEWVLDTDWHAEDDDGMGRQFRNDKYGKAFVAGVVIMEAAMSADNKSNADTVLDSFGVGMGL